MLLDQPHRLAEIRRLQNNSALYQLSQQAAQRITNELVIIDQQNFHADGLYRRCSKQLLHLITSFVRGRALDSKGAGFLPADYAALHCARLRGVTAQLIPVTPGHQRQAMPLVGPSSSERESFVAA